MHSSDFIWEHVNWVIAAVCFYIGFRGVVLQDIPWNWPGPFGYLFPTEYLGGSSAKLVGVVSLASGVVAIFSTFYGVLGFLGAYLLTWILGTFGPQR